MALQIRWISLLLRKRDSAKECARTVRSFEEWRHAQHALPAPRRSHGDRAQPKLLIIRLDDIGDYLLFRNQLHSYRESDRWKHHHITLLGNGSWREFFEAFDEHAVDEVIWINKAKALTSPDYRLELWKDLRARGFETAIAPSRTRPLLLDDLCMLAAAPVRAIGAVNTYMHQNWNQLSDALYQELFQPTNSRVHEFSFNGEFAAWCCGRQFAGKRPELQMAAGSSASAQSATPYIVCFVGATTRSKRWPAKRWIEFIEHYHRTCSGRVLVAGNSRREIETAAFIAARTGAQSIAGRVSLVELVSYVAGARAIISNDTMAAHLGVSCNRPTVIIANGVNYERFTDYAPAGIDRVTSVYPAVFICRRKSLGDVPYHYPRQYLATWQPSGQTTPSKHCIARCRVTAYQMQTEGPLAPTSHTGRVCAVCVTYHPDANLAERLSQLLPQVSHLIIVDNGSSAPALRMLNDIAKDDRVTLIPCKDNLGIARGLNIGIEGAINLACDYALLVDQDTSVNEDLVKVLTSIHRQYADKDRLAVVGAGYADSEPPPNMRAGDSEFAFDEMQTVITSGSLLWLKVFQNIGPFREEFFIDYVDSDYCVRAWKKGYLVVRARQTLMLHEIGHPVRQRFLWMVRYTRNYPPDRLYYQSRNDTVMLRESGKYSGGAWFFKAFGRSFRRCKRVMLFESHKTSKIVGVLHGWYDGVRGHLGPRKSKLTKGS